MGWGLAVANLLDREPVVLLKNEIPLTCTECGATFYTRYDTKRYCSTYCRKSAHKKNMNAARASKAVRSSNTK